jgi:SAM-dependent methyltransferase
MDIRTAHEIYLEQANWFKHLRTRYFRMASLQAARRVLEVGSGTSVVTAHVLETCSGLVVSVDRDRSALATGQPAGPGRGSRLLADGLRLPFGSGSFDAVVCQMVFMWVREPLRLADEAYRVLAPGGTMIACAEPDYGGALEHPESCSIMGLIAGHLYKEGADPMVGRKLPGLFPQERWDIVDLQVHPMGSWNRSSGEEAARTLIARVERELGGRVQEKVLMRWADSVRREMRRGGCFLFVPHFALLARKRI